MTELNHKAWAESLIGFIRAKDLESELKDWCGGWPCPITASRVSEDCLKALKAYQQADIDGVLVKVSRQALDEAIQALVGGSPSPSTASTDVPVQLQARKPDGGDWIDIYPAQLEWMAKEGNDVRALTAVATPAPSDAMRKIAISVIASLAAAISLLERVPNAKKAAPSNKMFEQMLCDYRNALENARAALSVPASTEPFKTELIAAMLYEAANPTMKWSYLWPSHNHLHASVRQRYMEAAARFEDATRPSPAPAAVEALKAAKQFIENGVEFGYIKMPTGDDPAHGTLPKIKAALAALAAPRGIAISGNDRSAT